jgi:predicted NBD/HSP70 family sugar kinase
MNHPTTLGIDFGGPSIKFGVVQDGRIISHGNVVSTRQDGEIEPLIRSIVDEILGLQREYLRFRRSALGCRALSPLPRP